MIFCDLFSFIFQKHVKNNRKNKTKKQKNLKKTSQKELAGLRGPVAGALALAVDWNIEEGDVAAHALEMVETGPARRLGYWEGLSFTSLPLAKSQKNSKK